MRVVCVTGIVSGSWLSLSQELAGNGEIICCLPSPGTCSAELVEGTSGGTLTAQHGGLIATYPRSASPTGGPCFSLPAPRPRHPLLLRGDNTVTTSPDKPLHIDIPVRLDNVKAVFSVGALAFEGDLPASIFHLPAKNHRSAPLMLIRSFSDRDAWLDTRRSSAGPWRALT